MSVLQLRRVLAYFFLASYLVILAITRDSLDLVAAQESGALALMFAATVWLTYGVIYLAPAMFLTWVAERVLHSGRMTGRATVLYPLVVGVTAATSLFFHANAKLFSLYGIFINSFVVNLVTTPGGIESLGASEASNRTFVAIAAGFLLFQAALLAAVHFLYRTHGEPRWVPRGLFKGLLIAFLFATATERMAYAYATVKGMGSIALLTQKVPYYLPLSARGLLGRLGIKVKPGKSFKPSEGTLKYPLNVLDVEQPNKPLNIVWLVAESWRHDMLDPEIMPHTWAFAQRAWQFRHHLSGGNGTRVGMFSMFTGIPGNYWFPMLAERKGAPIIDVLKAQDYQMSLYTSARFSYPEFDATIFSQVPPGSLHEIPGTAPGWRKDQENVGQLIDFIARRERGRPFFTFMFFESPHARYYFPPESVIRRPYPDDIDYFALGREQLASQIDGIKNRYINSVHHLDEQFGRILTYLELNGLLDSTIVVMLGDHGEEFMENGRWGHNSTFSDPQIRTPLVLWVPGKPATIRTDLTTHMDIIPTVFPLLGVKNSARDYSSGIDLFSDSVRQHAVLAEWSSTGYIDHEAKISMPLAMAATAHPLVTGPQDQALTTTEQDALFARKSRAIGVMLEEMGRYLDKKRS